MSPRACLAIGVLLASGPTQTPGGTGPPAAGVVVIRAARIEPVIGEPIDGGTIVVRDGKIAAVGGDVDLPPDAQVIELPGAVITPGLIDAHAAIDSEIAQAATFGPRRGRRGTWNELADRVAAARAHHLSGNCDDVLCAICAAARDAERSACEHVATHATGVGGCCAPCAGEADLSAAAGLSAGVTWAEHAAEVTPHLRVLDSVNLLSNDFERLLRGGVTTVWVSPDSGSVIGMRGAIVKTGGPLAERVVRAVDAVKAVMGRDAVMRGSFNRPPSGGDVTVFTRRPTTRMGVHWVFRKAFYDAQAAAAGRALHGADQPPAAALPVLMQILSGEVPLRVQARMQHDIITALRLAEEFGLGGDGRPPFILEEAIEAYRCISQLRSRSVPVILGPIFDEAAGFRARTGEARQPRLNAARLLLDAGITTALTAHDMRDEEGLAAQAMLAMRYGLTRGEALRAVTATPADLLGLRGRIGSLAPGADADLVAWSGPPFDATSRPVLVMINGTVVLRGES